MYLDMLEEAICSQRGALLGLGNFGSLQKHPFVVPEGSVIRLHAGSQAFQEVTHAHAREGLVPADRHMPGLYLHHP